MDRGRLEGVNKWILRVVLMQVPDLRRLNRNKGVYGCEASSRYMIVIVFLTESGSGETVVQREIVK